MNSFDYRFGKNKQLVAFPPDFEAIKCKPLLFDLALSALEFPNLESRKVDKTATKSGSFWNFWKS